MAAAAAAAAADEAVSTIILFGRPIVGPAHPWGGTAAADGQDGARPPY